MYERSLTQDLTNFIDDKAPIPISDTPYQANTIPIQRSIVDKFDDVAHTSQKYGKAVARGLTVVGLATIMTFAPGCFTIFRYFDNKAIENMKLKPGEKRPKKGGYLGPIIGDVAITAALTAAANNDDAKEWWDRFREKHFGDDEDNIYDVRGDGSESGSGGW